MKGIIDLVGQIGLAFVPKKWQPFAKALLPFVVGIGTAVVHGATTGAWDQAAIIAGITGVLSALLVYAVPNLHKTASRSHR